RSMKKCERRIPVLIRLDLVGLLGRRRCGGSALRFHRDFHAGARPHQSLDDHAVASPSLTTRKPSSSWPSVTYFCRATPPSSTTSTNLRACSVPIAASGTKSAV